MKISFTLCQNCPVLFPELWHRAGTNPYLGSPAGWFFPQSWFQLNSGWHISSKVLNQTLLLFSRPICGVAGIQSSQNHVQHSSAAPVSLPHCSHSGGSGSSLGYRSQLESSSPAMLMSSSPQTPQTQEQNGILDWLRKLRLHKYYPVFKQLTMEKVRQEMGGETARF